MKFIVKISTWNYYFTSQEEQRKKENYKRKDGCVMKLNEITYNDVQEMIIWLWVRSDFPTGTINEDIEEIAEQLCADQVGSGFNGKQFKT